MNELIPLIPDLRTEPIQQRSADRMEAILNATASIVDTDGIDAVTTTSVAFRSGSSVGVLYRYFPNITSLLNALARRNLQRYLDKVQEGSDLTPKSPWSSWDNTLDAYVEMCRKEAGFRGLKFGDIITKRFLSTEESNVSVVAKAFAGLIAETHAVPITKDMLFHLEVATTLGMSLVDLAFENHPRGDKRIIEHARGLIGDYLRTNIPIQAP